MEQTGQRQIEPLVMRYPAIYAHRIACRQSIPFEIDNIVQDRETLWCSQHLRATSVRTFPLFDITLSQIQGPRGECLGHGKREGLTFAGWQNECRLGLTILVTCWPGSRRIIYNYEPGLYGLCHRLRPQVKSTRLVTEPLDGIHTASQVGHPLPSPPYVLCDDWIHV